MRNLISCGMERSVSFAECWQVYSSTGSLLLCEDGNAGSGVVVEVGVEAKKIPILLSP